MNKSILLGRLTKKPEIRYSQTNNTKIAIFSLAVDRKYVKSGEERQTDFINIVTYSKLADFAENYLNQGMKICIAGRIQTRNWEDNNGNRRYTTEVIAEEIDFADAPRNNNEKVSSTNISDTIPTVENTDNEFISDGDDLPF